MAIENNNNENKPEKIPTRFSGLHAAMGRKPEELEVLPAIAVGDKGADANNSNQNNSGENNTNTETKNEGGTNTEEGAQPENKGVDLENLSDEDIDKLIEKRTKGKVKSLAALEEPETKTKEQLEQEAKQRQDDALSWAIESGKVKREEYDSAIILKSKTDDQLALEAFTANLQAEDGDVTPEEAAELFKDVYHLGQKEDSPLYKAGQREIKKLAAAVRNEKTGILDQIEPEYDNFTQTQTQFKAFKKQVKTLAAAAPKTVDFAIPYKGIDGSEETLSYSADVDPAVLNKIVNELTHENAFVMRNISTNGKINEKALAEELTYHVKARMFDIALPQLLEKHGKEVEQRLMVVLGNKKNGNQPLANGQQPGPSTTQKPNQYPGLNDAMKKYMAKG